MTNEALELLPETDLLPTSHQIVIEMVIASLDQNQTAMSNHSSNGHLWKFRYGSVEVFVQLTGETDDDILTVWATVLTLPVRDELGLFKEVMEMNWSSTFETCFSLSNNELVVSVQRTVAELSPGEISRAITLVATIADDNDERLKEKFA